MDSLTNIMQADSGTGKLSVDSQKWSDRLWDVLNENTPIGRGVSAVQAVLFFIWWV